jgi:hypothetical protein
MVTIQSFPAQAHDMLRDQSKVAVFQAISQWLDTVFPVASKGAARSQP